MLRCAFAHNIMDPKWEVKKKYAKTYTIEIPENLGVSQLNLKALSEYHIFSFNFEKLNNLQLEFSHFKGIYGLISLTLYALHLIEK